MSSAGHVSGRGIFNNLSLLLGGKTVAAIVSLVYILIVTRALGPSGFGVLVLVHGWTVTVGGIIAFSGWHGIVRYGAQALEAGDRSRLVRLARFTTLVELGCGLTAILFAAGFAGFAAPRLGIPDNLVWLTRIYALAIFANMLTTPVGILQLAGRFDRLALHPALSPSVRLVAVLIVWFGGGGIEGFLYAWLVSAISEGAFMWWLAWPVFREMRGGEPLLGPASARGENPGLVRFLATANADLTLRDIAPKAVPLIVGAILGPAATGIYSLAVRAAVILQQPAVQLAQASYPVIAKLLAAGELARARSLSWKTSFTTLAVAVPLVLLLAFFSRQILEIMGGKAFGSGAFVFILLMIGRAGMLAAVPLSSLLLAMGRTTASILVNIGINLFTLPLLVWLLSTDGLSGAGWYGAVTGIGSFVVLAMLLSLGNRRARVLQPEAEIAAAIDPTGNQDG
ncbi:Lipopolysaccharide biosynthesis protein [Sphingomonas antarctica]|uniref:lipopolysaccharide biosynthesis protein n=1 Tax=Sphingomonas antarctica TaxID=2040274 RepID=UPI0039E85E9F